MCAITGNNFGFSRKVKFKVRQVVDYYFYLAGRENVVPVLVTQMNQFCVKFGVVEYPAAKYLGGVFKG